MARACSLFSTSTMIQALCSPSEHPQSACVRKCDPLLRKASTARRHDTVVASCGTSIRNLAVMCHLLVDGCASRGTPGSGIHWCDIFNGLRSARGAPFAREPAPNPARAEEFLL